jgi:hypothetical protein
MNSRAEQVYFVAHAPIDVPHNLVAGPFLDYVSASGQAQSMTANAGSRYIVVWTDLTFHWHSER